MADDNIPVGEVFDEKDEENNKDDTRLGQLLIREDLITPEQLESALRKQSEARQENQVSFLGQILVELGAIRQEVLINALVKQTRLPYLNLLNYEIDQAVLDLIPEEVCQTHLLLPLDKLGKNLTIAMCNPADQAALDIISRLWPDLRLRRIMCGWPEFQAVFAKHFGKEKTAQTSEITLKSLGRQR
ncbi:MAG: hypothetical protein A3J65_00260 [Candidatus Buchananbacteria bacterium RIFCSPHIGHO2_02_FULL_45_11b]|uniref:Type II secretion system protein GspE N-terminal domain-containing protein n=4 Tax=Candidatus Buchananiibacteriota TaxID=1817903 RepID=A0A1G1YLJ4_9BACT|nr:MAG: hypothetical protein A2663_01810 [Candidatus Buchananbacteria bacterium RIFCSPHIGHO2_01_FULL_46_12]OGY52686.1 MAG: hypothetical protein A3J65_00260 [Candidatus Buchananbacteria bacterium RIFCSPHIGHO2_02_FULL_45_11b]OGY52919.1 MAG: hypothetical protein A3B15_02235 [Candidatus Buchananbacteria bacterium RIFCSPLOWO2_01_FULL_45_31]OGY56857.1 MAG: hypothetical protein A3H67_01930 [Candidatus Buchananbacteria bacterium RIFCSPLOWO2_02_FULL_46_11b]